MKALLFAAAAMLGATAAPAFADTGHEDWRVLRFNDIGGERYRVVYYDAGFQRSPTPTSRRIRVLDVYEKPRKLATETMTALQALYDVDCGTMTGHRYNSAAYDGDRIVATTEATPDGPLVRFDYSSPYREAAESACKNDLSLVPVTAWGTPGADAPLRFMARTAVEGSLKSTDWVRVGDGGDMGKRMALFVDRSGIITDGSGNKMAPVLVLDESMRGADHPFRQQYAMTVDCTGKSRVNIYVEAYSDGGAFLGDQMSGDVTELKSGTVLNGLLSMCTDNWSGMKAYPMLSSAIGDSGFGQ